MLIATEASLVYAKRLPSSATRHPGGRLKFQRWPHAANVFFVRRSVHLANRFMICLEAARSNLVQIAPLSKTVRSALLMHSSSL